MTPTLGCLQGLRSPETGSVSEGSPHQEQPLAPAGAGGTEGQCFHGQIRKTTSCEMNKNVKRKKGKIKRGIKEKQFLLIKF